MTRGNKVVPLVSRSSHGTHLPGYLAADGTGFPGGQVAVVAAPQVDTHFLSDKHLEAVHGLTSLGDIQLVVVGIAHNVSLLCFLRKKILSEERFSFP